MISDTAIADKLIYFAERKGYFYNWQPMQYYFGENSVVMVNFLHRWKFSETFKENSSVFFYWYLRDSDNLMTLSHNVYKSVYHFWIPMLFNDMNNPFFCFPMKVHHFNEYVKKKYGEDNLLNVHHYETVEDPVTRTPAGIITSVVTEEDYENLKSGKIIPVTNYEYENKMNESKRRIKLIHDKYIDDILLERDKIISAKFQNTVYKKDNYIFV